MRAKNGIMNSKVLSLYVAVTLGAVLVSVTFDPNQLLETIQQFNNEYLPEAASSSSSSSISRIKTEKERRFYQGSPVEDFVMNHLVELGYNRSENPDRYRPSGCDIWKNKTSHSNIKLPANLTSVLSEYRNEKRNYQKRLAELVTKISQKTNVTDLRRHLDDDVCDELEMNLPTLFPSGALSYSTEFGYMEPMLPPMRDPEICFQRRKLLSLDYLIHDFAALCRKLKRTSRIVYVDMGASLDFHQDIQSPAIYITELFQSLGFKFDHIYAYEVTEKKPENVYKRVPDDLMSAYHWINVGVSKEVDSKMNPLKLLIDNFEEDDFVVVKLDIDFSPVEVPLAFQILHDERISNLIDVFYIEHNIELYELQSSWGRSMKGTLAESLQLFRGIREKGVAAHSWV